jgi:PAS domain S-box-containing protein
VISASTAMPGTYDYGEVARSVLIAIAASYVALDFAGRVTAARARIRLAWLGGGATAMGVGIWEMDLKGMLALRLPVPVAYHWPTLLAALLVAILASAIALFVASRQKMGWVEALTGSVVMGSGIAGLHYLCMAAMRLPAITHYSSLLVSCSILLAILFSLIALLMAFGLREETKWSVRRRLGSATVMGVAVSAMHYTAMAAASFIPSSPPDSAYAVNITPLGNFGVVIVTLIVLGAAVATSSVDKRTDAEIRRLNQDLERRVSERTSELAEVNQELKRFRDELRLVVDTIPQQIWSGPSDGSLDFCNERWRSYTGLTLGELQGEGWQRMLHPEDRERVVHAWNASVASGVPYQQEERHRRTDGVYRWFLARGVPLRNVEGRIARWYGTNTDIEDWKRAEEALQRSRSDLEKALEEIKRFQDQLRLVINTVPAMVWSALPDGSIDFANQRWLEYFGYPFEKIRGSAWTDAIHPEDRTNTIATWHADLARTEPFEFEARLRRADGEYRWFLTRGVPLRDELGNIVKWYGTKTDIEDLKRTDDEIRRQKEILQKIFEHIPATIAFIGRNSQIELVNPEWERTTGWTLKEMRQRHVDITAEFFPDLRYRQMVCDFIATSAGQWTDLKIRVRDGRVIDGSVAILHLSDGSSLVIGQDITERKRREMALQEAQARLAHITRAVAMGEIAHEVNQPLTAIVTNANFCLRHLANATPNLENLREAIEEIANDGTRASEVIARIRGLLQKGAPGLVELDLNQTVQQVTDLLRDELTRNRISLRADLASDLPHVSGDPIQLQQVLINLVMNGVDAMRSLTHRPRELLIRSTRNHNEVFIQVHDSGEGLDPQQAERIFQPFFTTKPEGVGMGLSISRSIIESHGGRLWAESSSGGALFQFTLPLQ